MSTPSLLTYSAARSLFVTGTDEQKTNRENFLFTMYSQLQSAIDTATAAKAIVDDLNEKDKSSLKVQAICHAKLESGVWVLKDGCMNLAAVSPIQTVTVGSDSGYVQVNFKYHITRPSNTVPVVVADSAKYHVAFLGPVDTSGALALFGSADEVNKQSSTLKNTAYVQFKPGKQILTSASEFNFFVI